MSRSYAVRSKYPPPPHVDPKIEGVARLLCQQRGYDDDQLEPGDGYGVDAILPNTDPAHYLWRAFVEDATQIVEHLEGTRL
jgi:hypothetical protein